MRILAAALLPLILTACEGVNLFGGGASPQPRQIVSSSQLQNALDQRGGALPSRQARQDVPEITPAALVGASGAQIRSWLGRPDAQWNESGHALWRYAATDCVVLLFVDPGETVRKVNVLRMDGNGSAGCERAISERVAGAQTS